MCSGIFMYLLEGLSWNSKKRWKWINDLFDDDGCFDVFVTFKTNYIKD